MLVNVSGMEHEAPYCFHTAAQLQPWVQQHYTAGLVPFLQQICSIEGFFSSVMPVFYMLQLSQLQPKPNLLFRPTVNLISLADTAYYSITEYTSSKKMAEAVLILFRILSNSEFSVFSLLCAALLLSVTDREILCTCVWGKEKKISPKCRLNTSHSEDFDRPLELSMFPSLAEHRMAKKTKKR